MLEQKSLSPSLTLTAQDASFRELIEKLPADLNCLRHSEGKPLGKDIAR